MLSRSLHNLTIHNQAFRLVQSIYQHKVKVPLRLQLLDRHLPHPLHLLDLPLFLLQNFIQHLHIPHLQLLQTFQKRLLRLRPQPLQLLKLRLQPLPPIVNLRLQQIQLINQRILNHLQMLLILLNLRIQLKHLLPMQRINLIQLLLQR